MIDLITGFLPYIAGAVALITAYFVNNKVQQNKGKKKQQQKAKEADRENAVEIRDNVKHNLDKRVRDLDDAGFRD